MKMLRDYMDCTFSIDPLKVEAALSAEPREQNEVPIINQVNFDAMENSKNHLEHRLGLWENEFAVQNSNLRAERVEIQFQKTLYASYTEEEESLDTEILSEVIEMAHSFQQSLVDETIKKERDEAHCSEFYQGKINDMLALAKKHSKETLKAAQDRINKTQLDCLAFKKPRRGSSFLGGVTLAANMKVKGGKTRRGTRMTSVFHIAAKSFNAGLNEDGREEKPLDDSSANSSINSISIIKNPPRINSNQLKVKSSVCGAETPDSIDLPPISFSFGVQDMSIPVSSLIVLPLPPIVSAGPYEMSIGSSISHKSDEVNTPLAFSAFQNWGFDSMETKEVEDRLTPT
jgi:hypothetical protein